MIRKTYLKEDRISHCSISLTWEVDPLISLSHLMLKVTRHSPRPEVLGTIQISSLAIGYDLTSLTPSTVYEFQLAPCDSKRQYSWSNLLICTTLKLPSRDLYYRSEKLVIESRPSLNGRVSTDSREIINARNLKGWKDYVNCGFKFAKPKEKREIMMKRMMNYVNVTDFFEENDFFSNDDCFQGPYVVNIKKE